MSMDAQVSDMLVFDDADIQRVADATQQSIYFNTGQVFPAADLVCRLR